MNPCEYRGSEQVESSSLTRMHALHERGRHSSLAAKVSTKRPAERARRPAWSGATTQFNVWAQGEPVLHAALTVPVKCRSRVEATKSVSSCLPDSVIRFETPMSSVEVTATTAARKHFWKQIVLESNLTSGVRQRTKLKGGRPLRIRSHLASPVIGVMNDASSEIRNNSPTQF